MDIWTTFLNFSLSNTQVTTKFPPGQDTLNLIFRSDSEYNRKGFIAKVRQVRDSCQPGESRGQRRIGLLPAMSSIPLNNYQSQETCDLTVSDYNGFIKSPNFPASYPPNKLCTFTVTRAASHVCRVDMLVRSFSLYNEFKNSNCYSSRIGDFLEMPDRTRMCGESSGKAKTFMFPATSNHMNLVFQSDAEGSSTGLNIEVRQIPHSCDFHHARGKSWPPTRLVLIFCTPEMVCDSSASGPYFRIRSPNYPGQYPPNSHCVYDIIKANKNYCGVTLDLIRFSLEPPDRYGMCNKDYLQLPDGTRWCGSKSGRSRWLVWFVAVLMKKSF